MFAALRGEPYRLWRAVDEQWHRTRHPGAKARRDKTAAKRFFRRALRSNPAPRKIVTDQFRSYLAVHADIP
jgi:putative transposase